MKMILTELQKEIIDKIISGEINDIVSFLKWKYDDKKIDYIKHGDLIVDSNNKTYRLNFSFQKYDNEEVHLSSYDLSDKGNIYFIEDFSTIGQLISLWDKLEKEGYVISTKRVLDRSQLLCYTKRDKVLDFSTTFNISGMFKELSDSYNKLNKLIEEQYPDLSPEERENKLNKLISETDEQNKKDFTYEKAAEMLNTSFLKSKYREDYFFLISNDELISYVGTYIDKQMIPLIDLKEFKMNKYQSASDIRFRDEKRGRIIAQLITVLIAVVSLFFNYHFTSNNDSTQKQLNEAITKVYQSQEKLNDFYLKYDKILSQHFR